jgi:hypothetical protein
MSYIINNTNPFVSIKMTEKGREQLSMGQLNFSFWGIGDSEINYSREAIVDGNPAAFPSTSKIMRPFDRQPNIKSFITPSGSQTPYQLLDNGNVNVVKAIVNNSAKERGFFTNVDGVYTAIEGGVYSPYSVIVSNINLVGTNKIAGFSSTTSFTVGDMILLTLANNRLSIALDDSSTKPLPKLWFKIISLDSTSITLDRKTPNYSLETTYSSKIVVYKSGEVHETIATENTTAYWDSGTLSFDSASNVTCHDVPVWNMNNVWCENIAGITGLSSTRLYEDYTKFGSFDYLGAKNPYLGYVCGVNTEDIQKDSPCSDGTGVSYDDDISKSVSILHYTNNTISNLYGEFLYIDTTKGKTVKITIPNLMYHRRNYSTGDGLEMGMTFVASGQIKFVGTSDIEYVELLEDATMVNKTPLVIGRVYPQLKTIVIHDDEIVAAISYKSNRNWTLPKLAANLTAPSSDVENGILPVDATMYLSYSLENTNNGLITSLPNQNYVKISNATNTSKDVSFRLIETDLLPYMRKKELVNDGFGFYADKFKLIYQIVLNSDTRPDPGAWKTCDFTSNFITYGQGQTIDPKNLENQNPILTGFNLTSEKDNSATIFSIIETLNMAPNNSPSNLQFGDEKFFYGNLKTYIGATIYKTIFDIRVNSSQFNSTSNPTRSKDLATNPPVIKVSEVGIYDENKNLVCIGKLNTPIPLSAGNTIMLELSMDF